MNVYTAAACLIVLSGVFSVAFYLYRQIKKAGADEEKLDNEVEENEILKIESNRMASRPRTAGDRLNRLRKWHRYVKNRQD